tara:strand:- start:214 stop:408 length:195 start_codon:yes stop_codon:yes gene_type:complete
MNFTKLTSVKILINLYEQFKILTVNTKMSLQKLSNRSVHLYLTDDDFKEKIDSHDDLTISGSNF